MNVTRSTSTDHHHQAHHHHPNSATSTGSGRGAIVRGAGSLGLGCDDTTTMTGSGSTTRSTRTRTSSPTAGGSAAPKMTTTMMTAPKDGVPGSMMNNHHPTSSMMMRRMMMMMPPSTGGGSSSSTSSYDYYQHPILTSTTANKSNNTSSSLVDDDGDNRIGLARSFQHQRQQQQRELLMRQHAAEHEAHNERQRLDNHEEERQNHHHRPLLQHQHSSRMNNNVMVTEQATNRSIASLQNHHHHHHDSQQPTLTTPKTTLLSLQQQRGSNNNSHNDSSSTTSSTSRQDDECSTRNNKEGRTNREDHHHLVGRKEPGRCRPRKSPAGAADDFDKDNNNYDHPRSGGITGAKRSRCSSSGDSNESQKVGDAATVPRIDGDDEETNNISNNGNADGNRKDSSTGVDGDENDGEDEVDDDNCRNNSNSNKIVIVQGDRKTPGANVRMRLLPPDFVPSDRDVLCGRGRVCKMARGNIAYRKLVESKLPEYAAAKTKLEKGMILSEIVTAVRRSCMNNNNKNVNTCDENGSNSSNSCDGGFIKQDPQTGRWYEVGDFLAREKTSQCFRDALHDQYSSSAQAKYKRRKEAELWAAGATGTGTGTCGMEGGSINMPSMMTATTNTRGSIPAASPVSSSSSSASSSSAILSPSSPVVKQQQQQQNNHQLQLQLQQEQQHDENIAHKTRIGGCGSSAASSSSSCPLPPQLLPERSGGGGHHYDPNRRNHHHFMAGGGSPRSCNNNIISEETTTTATMTYKQLQERYGDSVSPATTKAQQAQAARDVADAAAAAAVHDRVQAMELRQRQQLLQDHHRSLLGTAVGLGFHHGDNSTGGAPMASAGSDPTPYAALRHRFGTNDLSDLTSALGAGRGIFSHYLDQRHNVMMMDSNSVSNNNKFMLRGGAAAYDNLKQTRQLHPPIPPAMMAAISSSSSSSPPTSLAHQNTTTSASSSPSSSAVLAMRAGSFPSPRPRQTITAASADCDASVSVGIVGDTMEKRLLDANNTRSAPSAVILNNNKMADSQSRHIGDDDSNSNNNDCGSSRRKRDASDMMTNDNDHDQQMTRQQQQQHVDDDHDYTVEIRTTTTSKKQKLPRRPSENAVASVLQQLAQSSVPASELSTTSLKSTSNENTSTSSSTKSSAGIVMTKMMTSSQPAIVSPNQSTTLSSLVPTEALVAGPPCDGGHGSHLLQQRASSFSLPSSSSSFTNDVVGVSSASTSAALPINCPSPPDRDEVRVCAMQLHLRSTTETPLDAVQRTFDSMDAIDKSSSSSSVVVDGGGGVTNDVDSSSRIDLFVLPELCPIGYSEDTFTKYLPTTLPIQNMYKQIDNAFSRQAKRLNAYICYGTIGWYDTDTSTTLADEEACHNDNNDDNRDDMQQRQPRQRFTIQQVVVNRQGVCVARYDKLHLCDYGACAETRFFVTGQGNNTVSFEIDGFRFGLMICADIRYPELARTLVRDHNIDVILQPSAFYRDISFRTWKSFRETRAIENSCYFIAINYAGENYGDSSIIPPWIDDNNDSNMQQHEPLQLSTTEGYLIGRINKHELNHIRNTMPFYNNIMKER